MRLRDLVLGLSAGGVDPFAVLGLPATMAIDARELERTYLRLSRESHPDFDPDGAVRMAEINEAYRTLRDPWSRAQALVDRHDARLMEQRAKLDPAFLMDALELAEEVAQSRGEPADELRERIRHSLDDTLKRVRDACAEGQQAYWVCPVIEESKEGDVQTAVDTMRK